VIVEVIAPAPTVLEITEPDPNEVEVSYVRGLKGDQGDQGEQGIQGATGATGPQGSSGVIAVDGTYITNSGTSTSANLSFVPSALTLAQSQVTGLVTALAGKAALTASQTFTGTQTFIPANASSRAMSIAAFSAAQSTDILQIYGTAGTLIHRVASNNALYFGISGSFLSSSGRVLAISDVASTVAVTARGAASQSANLQEWQNSAGTVIARIEPSGRFGNTGGSYIGGPNGQVFATTTSASTIPLISRGAASQSANLQEWQNSAGSVLARIGSDGTLTTPLFVTPNANVRIEEGNSGGLIRLVRLTAAPSVPGANIGRLYFKAGTTGLALFAMGPTGTEVRIADNIT
jgi:hypothetical protein